MVDILNAATHDQESVEVRIITEDLDREKVATFSRSFNNFLGRTLEKCPDKRSTIKEVAICDVASARFLDQDRLVSLPSSRSRT
jgi:FMN-dependent NADH-azoreductase